MKLSIEFYDNNFIFFTSQHKHQDGKSLELKVSNNCSIQYLTSLLIRLFCLSIDQNDISSK